MERSCLAYSVNDVTGLVPISMSLPWPAMPLAMWRACPHATYFPPPPKKVLALAGTHRAWQAMLQVRSQSHGVVNGPL